MVEAMLLGGLRCCEVLGLRMTDVNIGERRLFITEGKGGRQRIVPISSRFFQEPGRVHRRGAATDLIDRAAVRRAQRSASPTAVIGG